MSNKLVQTKERNVGRLEKQCKKEAKQRLNWYQQIMSRLEVGQMRMLQDSDNNQRQKRR